MTGLQLRVADDVDAAKPPAHAVAVVEALAQMLAAPATWRAVTGPTLWQAATVGRGCADGRPRLAPVAPQIVRERAPARAWRGLHRVRSSLRFEVFMLVVAAVFAVGVAVWDPTGAIPRVIAAVVSGSLGVLVVLVVG